MANRRFGLQQVLRDDKSTCLVSMQRFRGRLDGREGTFVLQGSEIVENSKIKATWFVVPGSGTGTFPGCAAKAVSKVTLEKGPKEPWIIGSNDVVTIHLMFGSLRRATRDSN